MAKFLTGNELNTELEKLFENASEQIILISPYIKLHERFASTLLTKKDNPKIEIIIVFGKNEEDLSRSMKQEDFNFFKEFPNIEIRYEKRLHAKYYCNESSAILTSMNLYNYSQDNNIEAGILTKVTLLGSFDLTAYTYFKRVIDQSNLLFKKVPDYESAIFGLSKKYKTSKIEVDKLTDFFENKPKYDIKKENYEKNKIPLISKSIDIIVDGSPEINNSKNKVPADLKYLSTTALSKEIGIGSKELFSKFEKLNWIERKNEDWILTTIGKEKGAQTKKGQYGEYIAWPETIINEIK